MTMTEWLSDFQPIRNPERPQSNSAYGFRCFMFDIISLHRSDLKDRDPYENHKLWSLIRKNGKPVLVNGFHPNDAEGFFMARVEWDRDYEIRSLT